AQRNDWQRRCGCGGNGNRSPARSPGNIYERAAIAASCQQHSVIAPRGEHGPAMIAAFGMAYESEPGLLEIADAQVRRAHITRLAADGSGKAGTERDKIMLGSSIGYPIVLAPTNDLLGLSITEGIEDALSVYDGTGLGAWAAGSAARLPALADIVPGLSRP